MGRELLRPPAEMSMQAAGKLRQEQPDAYQALKEIQARYNDLRLFTIQLQEQLDGLPPAGGEALDVTDGTTTVTDPPVLDFDPTYFDVTDSGGNAEVTFVGPAGSASDVTDGTTTVTAPPIVEFDEDFFDVTDNAGDAFVSFVGPSDAPDVTDGTTTVTAPPTIEFDPTYFDVTDSSGDAAVTFIGSAGGGDIDVGADASVGSEDLYKADDTHRAFYGGSPYILHGFKQHPITLGDWSWINQGTSGDAASVSALLGGAVMTAPHGSVGSTVLRIQEKAAPTPPYRIRACVTPTLYASGDPGVFVGVRNATDGKLSVLIAFRSSSSGNIGVGLASYNSPTSWAGTYTQTIATTPGAIVFDIGGPWWLEYEDNGTYRFGRFSLDGVHFVQVHTSSTISRTDFVTGDRIIWGVHKNTTAIQFANFMSLEIDS